MPHDVCAFALSEGSILNFEHQRHKPCRFSLHLESSEGAEVLCWFTNNLTVLVDVRKLIWLGIDIDALNATDRPHSIDLLLVWYTMNRGVPRQHSGGSEYSIILLSLHEHSCAYYYSCSCPCTCSRFPHDDRLVEVMNCLYPDLMNTRNMAESSRLLKTYNARINCIGSTAVGRLSH